MKRTSRWGLGVLLLFMSIGLAVETTRVSAKPPGVKITAQPVTYDALVKAVGDLKGKVVIVDFWAEYCPPCKKELKELLVLQRKYGRDGFVLLSVSLDEPTDKEARARIDDFLTQQQADCANFILDAGWREWQTKLKIAGPPCLYVFDRDNCLVHKHTGATNPEVIEAELVKLIKQGPSDKTITPSPGLIDIFQAEVLTFPPTPEPS